MKTADLATDGPGVLTGVTAAELRTDPQRFVGPDVAVDAAVHRRFSRPTSCDPRSPSARKYLLARGPLPERGFVYVVIPDGKRPLVASLMPLSVIQVTARVRAGRSHYLGNPVIDLLSLEAQAVP